MVYGAPSQNLALLSGVEYDLQDSISSVWTVAEIHIGPLIFVSPSHVRLVIFLNGRSADIVTILQSGYNSTLTATSKENNSITSFISSGWAGSTDYSLPQVLDADFYSDSGNNKIDFITVNSWVVMDGESIPGTSRAQTYTVNADSSINPARFFIEWIESAFTIVGKNDNPMRHSSYNTQHACLSPTPVQGQLHRIKNGSTDTTVFIHAFDKQIDNQNGALYINQAYGGLSFTENGFVLPPLHACMLMYDGTKWLIQEYFNAARLAGTFDWWAYIPAPVSIPLITKPVIICDTTAGNKVLQLPDPAGPLKLVRVIVIPATVPSATSLFLFPYTGTVMEDNRGNSFYLRAASASANACMTLISDGVQWWVANVYEGSNSFFITQTIERPLSTNPITVVRSPGVDGVRLPPITLSLGLANETFVKMDATSPFNGIVISTTDSTNVRIGSGANNCVYAGSPWKNYTAASVIGMFNGNSTIYFVTSYFSGF